MASPGVQEIVNQRAFKHTIVHVDGRQQLEVHLPDGVQHRELDLFTEEHPDGPHVCLTDSNEQLVLRLLLAGSVLDGNQAAFKKAQRKYVLRLLEREVSPEASSDRSMATAEGDLGAELSEGGPGLLSPRDPDSAVFHDALGGSSDGGSEPGAPQEPPTAFIETTLEQGDQARAEEVATGSEPAEANSSAAAAAKKKKKKKKRAADGSEGGAAPGSGEAAKAQAEDNDARGPSDQDMTDSSAVPAATAAIPPTTLGADTSGLTKAQKKRLKRKASKKAVPGANGHGSGASSGDEAGADALLTAPSPAAPPPADSNGHAPPPLTKADVMFDPFAEQAGQALSAEPFPESSTHGGPSPMPSYPSGPLLSSKSGNSRRVQVCLDTDFDVEPRGEVTLAAHKDKPVVAPDPLAGPFIRTAMSKNESKGEDKWLEAPGNKWELPHLQLTASFSAFGIFDGHGGKMAATYTSKNLLPAVGSYLGRAKGDVTVPEPPPGVTTSTVATWAAQDALIDRAPKALVAAFLDLDAECQRRFKTSGTTATLALCCGWELLVACVGDSCAFLDTGSEIIQVSGNHRVSENEEERERVQSAGGVLAQSDVDGKVAGPMRVWPGGLAMTRSIGDSEAGAIVTGEPEVRQITIPYAGARLIIASDGLWDAVTPKTLIHRIRKMVAGQAANIAMHTALDKKGLADDITVLIIDFCADPGDKLPASLAAATGTRGGAVLSAGGAAAVPLASGVAVTLAERSAQVWKPLEAPSSSWRDRLAAQRARAVAVRDAAAAREAEAVATSLEAAEAQHVAGLDSTAGAGPSCSSAAAPPSPEGTSLQELSEFRVDLEALDSLPAEEAADDGSWTTVKGSRPSSAPLPVPLAPPPAAELAEAAEPGGAGRGRGRGGRGGRGRRGGHHHFGHHGGHHYDGVPPGAAVTVPPPESAAPGAVSPGFEEASHAVGGTDSEVHAPSGPGGRFSHRPGRGRGAQYSGRGGGRGGRGRGGPPRDEVTGTAETSFEAPDAAAAPRAAPSFHAAPPPAGVQDAAAFGAGFDAHSHPHPYPHPGGGARHPGGGRGRGRGRGGYNGHPTAPVHDAIAPEGTGNGTAAGEGHEGHHHAAGPPPYRRPRREHGPPHGGRGGHLPADGPPPPADATAQQPTGSGTKYIMMRREDIPNYPMGQDGGRGRGRGRGGRGYGGRSGAGGRDGSAPPPVGVPDPA